MTTNRPDPALFARVSYYLAYATSGILVLALILSALKIGGTFIVWLAVITSAVGAFLAWAARSDFKRTPGSPEATKMARSGWRVNFYALLILLTIMILLLVVRLFLGSGALEVTVGG